MMDTDYEHYAIVYSQQKDSQEPSTMLQLYSGCLSNGGGGKAGILIATQGHCISTQRASTYPCPKSPFWGEQNMTLAISPLGTVLN